MKNLVLKLIYRVLASYARETLSRNNPTVIAVTGSVGKTSTKEAIYEVLAAHFEKDKVRKNFGNLNAEIGIPLTILGYEGLPNKFLWPIFLILASFRVKQKNYPDFLVLEMGVEHPGDIKYFSSIVRPDFGVITSLGIAHMTNFKSEEELRAEKLSLAEVLKPNGKIFINIDDIGSNIPQDAITIGIKNRAAEYRAINISFDAKGTLYDIQKRGLKINIKTKLLGKPAVYSQLFAFAVGQALSIQSLDLKQSIEKIAPIAGRMNLIKAHGKLVIDDTYNSNPSSVKAALDVLSEIKYKGRKVAILGNMNELGDLEEESHKSIGGYAADKCDLGIFVGPNAKLMAASSGDKGITFENRRQLIPELNKLLRPGDIILVKASQNKNFFEEVVKVIIDDDTLAKKILVRQSRYWLAKKNKQR